jgi:hypothetical protein
LRRSCIIPVLIFLLAIFVRGTCAQQRATSAAGVHGTVDVRLKLAGGEKFSGVASVRVLTTEGAEVADHKDEIGGRAHFADLGVGKYTVEVNAPGFANVRHEVVISAGQPFAAVFLTMTTEMAQASAAPGATLNTTLNATSHKTLNATSNATSNAKLEPTTHEEAEKSIHALQQEGSLLPVQPNIACPLPLVLQGVEQSVKELVSNLDRFSATERVEHFAVHADGGLGVTEARSFDYVVVVNRGGDGWFGIDEYRDGGLDPSRFPAGIATTGLPALALIFHPNFAPEFNFMCPGLVEWEGKPAWQVQFEQRPDRPNQIRSYIIYQNTYSVPLKGRALIDAGTFQVLRLDSELIKPVEKIKLMQERVSIDYAPVQFRTEEQQMWLPQSAELYVERGKSHYYRRHTFSNFQVFTVGTEQKVHAPKESYTFTNNSNHEIFGVLTVNPIPGGALHEVSITFKIPAGGTVFKVVGPGKDVNFPAEDVGSARFAHNGPPGSIEANAYFVNASTLELVPDSVVPGAQ